MGRISKKAKQKIPLKEIQRMDTQATQQKLQECYTRYRTYCQDSTQSRKSWLLELASARAKTIPKATEDGTEVAKQIQAKMHTENIRQAF